MGLRHVLRVSMALVTALGLAVVVNTPAQSAARLAAPSVSIAQADTGLVTVKGRTPRPKPRVRFDRSTRSGWVVVKRIRARHHRYATTLRVAPGTTATFRVVSRQRSRKFTVTMPALAPKLAAPKVKPTYDDCGLRPRKADGTVWSCTFKDDFDGSALDRTKWVPQRNYSGSAEMYACFRDNPANVNVAGGVLNLNLIKLDAPAWCQMAGLAPTNLMSGGVSTYGLFSQQYGRVEARIKNTASDAPGLHEAFWLWPDIRYSSVADWPVSGEIDIAETYSNHNDIVLPFLHYSADKLGIQYGVNTNPCAAQRGVYNTYTLEWTAKRIEIFVNGRSCLVNTSGDPAFQKPYIINLTQAIGPINNMPTASTTFPASMQIDYVRVWR